MLHRGGLRLALEAVRSVANDGQLSHIGLHTDDEELGRLRMRVRAVGCQVAVDREQALVFDDPFGVRWEINTFSYGDPKALSTGARRGLWLEV